MKYNSYTKFFSHDLLTFILATLILAPVCANAQFGIFSKKKAEPVGNDADRSRQFARPRGSGSDNRPKTIGNDASGSRSGIENNASDRGLSGNNDILVSTDDGAPSTESAETRKKIDELRQKQQKDLDNLRDTYDKRAKRECPRNKDGSIDTNSKQYKKLEGEYSNKHKEIRDTYVKQDPRHADFDPKNKIEGVKSTGSNPKDVRADADWTADTPEAAQKKVNQWESRGDKVIDDGYKVRNTTTDEVLWKPGYDNDPRKIADTDAYGTEGGRKATGAGGTTDAKGNILDTEKKLLAGKQSGNIKDQSKAVTKAGDSTGRSSAPEAADTYKKAKEFKNYGDDVTAGVTKLGDDPKTKQQKMNEYQKKLDAEMQKNKVEAEAKSQRTQDARDKLADSTKKAETAGDQKWNEAKNKANYDPDNLQGKTVDGKPVDTKTTSESIADRNKQVKESNKAAEDFNEKMKQDMDGGKSKTTAPETDAPGSGKTTAPDAPDTRTGKTGTLDAPETKVKGVTPDAPEISTKTGTPDLPETKIKTGAPDVPDAPKTKTTGAPDVEVKTKAGKALKAVGHGMDAIDIFGTAEDVKQDIKKGDYKGAATKAAEGVANELTAGGYGAIKGTAEKMGDKSEAEKAIAEANRRNEENYEIQSANKLRKAGLSKEEVDKLRQDKANGNDNAIENKMKEMGIKPPERIVEKGPVGDDTWTDRAKDVGQGIVDNTKKAGKFIKEAGEDLTEIGTGLTEKGVASEVANQTKENAKGWLETWRENRKAEQQEKDAHESMKDYFIKKGASEGAAEKAASDYEKGNKESGRKLSDMLDWKKDSKEAAEKGEERKDFDSWKKERDEARNPKPTKEKDLRDAEGKTDPTEQAEKGDGEKEGKGILDWLSGKKDEKDRENTESSTRIASSNKDMQDASTSGDQDDRESKNIINSAGRDAENTKDQATRESAKADRDNSMGKTMGDAIENSITKGGEALGGAIGKAGADKANENIYEKNKPEDDDGKETDNSGKPKVAGIKSTGDSPTSSDDGSKDEDTQVSSSDNNDKDDDDEDDDDEDEESDNDDDGDDEDCSGDSGSSSEECSGDSEDCEASKAAAESFKAANAKKASSSATAPATKTTPAPAPKPPVKETPKGYKCPCCGSYDTVFSHSHYLYGDVYRCNGCGNTVHDV